LVPPLFANISELYYFQVTDCHTHSFVVDLPRSITTVGIEPKSNIFGRQKEVFQYF
jgi:hypothetical protein